MDTGDLISPNRYQNCLHNVIIFIIEKYIYTVIIIIQN